MYYLCTEKFMLYFEMSLKNKCFFNTTIQGYNEMDWIDDFMCCELSFNLSTKSC